MADFKDIQTILFYGSHYSDSNDLLLTNLFNELVQANIESIIHKLYIEARIQINDYF